MALVLKDRVKETTSTTGTGTYTLAGAVAGFEAFSEIGNSNTTYYCCTDGTDFEVGIGTYTASGTTLARTTILQSSNSDAAVNWTSGTRTIFCTQPAEKAVSFDASGHINFADSGAPDYENRLRFGAGSDLQIFSDGTHGYFQGSSSNDLIAAFDEVKFLNQAYSKTRLKINSSDAVELYHDNSKKFETTSGGIDVTGTVTDDGATHDGDVTFTGASYNVLWDKSDNALELADNALIKVGAGDDMTISSDGTYPRIKANNIIVESNNADQGLYFRSNDTGDIVDYDTGTVFHFQQYNDNNEQTTYNRLLSISLDVTDGSEDGRFQFQSLKQGANTNTFIIDPYYIYLMAEQQLVWYQYNGSYNTHLNPLTPTANRYIKLPDRDGVIQVVDRQVMTSNLAVGWHTIAVFQGRDDSPGGANQRFHAKFTLLEYTSSRHQAFTFFAQHMYGQDDGLQVIGNSTFGTDVVTAIRIKSSTDSGNGLYAGAAIQVYVANVTNNLILYLDEADFDGDESGTTYGNVILKTGVADASDPGDLGYSSASYSTFASSVNIGIDSIEPGGIGVTGNLLTQSNIVLEGATADAHETIITATDATADRTITLPDATGQVVLSDAGIDTDATVEIGRAHIGNVGFTDFAGFSHIDQNTTGGYALLQSSGGKTYLNSNTGQSTELRINNASIASVFSAGLYIYSGKYIQFEGSTEDAHDTILNVADPTADRTITLPDATGTVQLTDGSGASLTSLNASQLSSGTVPNARLDAQLQDVAGLAVTNGGFIVGDGSNFVLETGATARTSLGLGTAATSATGDFATAAQGTTADAAMPKAGGTFTGDVTFTGDSYNVVWDKSDNRLEFADNAIASFGAGADLRLFHNGSISYIQDAGTGGLRIIGNLITLLNAANSETMLKATEDGAVELYHDNVKKLETTADGVDIVSTDAGSGIGPSLHLYRNSASPADFDDLGALYFTGNDDAGNRQEYAFIRGDTGDVSSGSEDASIRYFTNVGGSTVEHMSHSFGTTTVFGRIYLAAGTIHSDPHIRFEGSTSNNFETDLKVTDPTADRTITLPDATGTVLTTGNSDTPTTTTSSSDADFVLVDDGGTMKKITPANLGITAGAASTDDATALAIALG